MTDENLIGKVNVTGLALPSEFKQFIDNGASQAVALWNPIDLGYSAVYARQRPGVKEAEAKPGATISIGRVGEITLDDTNSAAMAAPFQFDKTQHRRVLQDLLIRVSFGPGARGAEPSGVRREACRPRTLRGSGAGIRAGPRHAPPRRERPSVATPFRKDRQ